MNRRQDDLDEAKVFFLAYIVIVTVTLAAWWP